MSGRLVLRGWTDADLGPLVRMNADPRVMEHFPATLSQAESAAMLERIRAHWATYGWGPWAVEEAASGEFVGLTGLSHPRFEAHFTPCVEIGWRLLPGWWGRGYAAEAAREALELAFERLGLPEVVAFTVPANAPSLRLMERLGLVRDVAGDFEHPGLPEGHALRKHVLYRMRAEHWAPRRRRGPEPRAGS